jgi:PIN domain nuclease of toxin-antitoxin system
VSSPAATPVLVFDASPLLAWVLQAKDQWQRVQRLLTSGADCVVPVSALIETLYMARKRGNTAPPAALRAALLAQGLRVEPIVEDDAEWAAATISDSKRNPARWTTNHGQHRQGTLSLGDALTLAAAHRLGAHAVTFDLAWWHFPTLTFELVNPWKVQP